MTTATEPLPDTSRAARDLVALMGADSTSGREAPAVTVAEAIARGLGLTPLRIPVAPGRDNLLVSPRPFDPARPPAVVLCTHIDTVPPFIPPSDDGTVIHGRGACDAKGAVIAMMYGLERACASAGGDIDAACLFVVGEETDHAGARAFAAAPLFVPRHIVLGEPCGVAPARGQKGLLKLQVTARGEAAHSAFPELGISAIHGLVTALARVLDARLPALDGAGETTVNIGAISGGTAPNVLAPSAEATLLIRCAAPTAAIEAVVLEALGISLAGETIMSAAGDRGPSSHHGHVAELAATEDRGSDRVGHATLHVTVLNRVEPRVFASHGVRPGPAVAFNTDANDLAGLGATLALLGPGDMRCAHGPHEHLSHADLAAGIDAYAAMVLRLV